MTRRTAALAGLVLAALTALAPSAVADSGGFSGLAAGTRVYDSTGRSVSADQAAALRRRLDALRSRSGADVVVVVRDLDADTDQTSYQVEELRRAWARATGADEDDVVTLLVNREPGTDDEGRAGVDVGATYDGGDAVPLRERQDVVADTLVPALRDGDIGRGLVAAVDRLARDIDEGPPREGGARGLVARSLALQWTYAALVLAGYVAALLVWRGRPRPTAPAMDPSPLRPDGTTPAWLGGALARNSLSVDLVPVVLLALATRGALVLDAERSGLRGRRWSLVLRRLDPSVARDEVEDTVWAELAERSRHGDVPRYGVESLANDRKLGRDALEDALRERGWLGHGRQRASRQLTAVTVGGAGALVALRFAAPDEATVVGTAALFAAVLFFASLGLGGTYPVLSSAGLDARRPWKAYARGLKPAVEDAAATGSLDLDVVLPDLVALGLHGTLPEAISAAVDGADVTALRRLVATVPDAGNGDAWRVFTATFARSSSDSSSGSSGGDGGGTAGST